MICERSMKNTDIQKAVVKAQKLLESGDPEDAVAALEMASRLQAPSGVKRLLWKAKDEAEIGSPERAETFVWMALRELNPIP